MKNLVSIIVPVYNASQWLDICIDSICNQTHKNIEIILINDGSTDNSEQICISWQEKDSRIKYIYQRNSGVSAARNRGLSEAIGEYICFIDSDDWISTNYISDMLNVAYSAKPDLVISGIIHEFNIRKTITPRRTEIIDKKNSCFERSLISVMETGLLYSPCVSLYKMSIIKKNSLKFRTGIHYGEDRIFNLDYLRHCNTITTVRNANYHYRHVEADSLSKLANERQLEMTIFLHHENKHFCDNLGFNSKEAMQWLYTPVYDAFTNHILKIRHYLPKADFKSAYRAIHKFINSEECINAVKMANLSAYPKLINLIFRYKQAFLLTLFIYIKNANLQAD